jgi:(S)-ureidoglycine aminohydrolase
MRDATAIVHIAPAGGACFTEYTAEFMGGGVLGPTASQRFIYVLEGKVDAGGVVLRRDGYAFLPQGMAASITAQTAARAVVIEKPYIPLPGTSRPGFFSGQLDKITPEPMLGDPDVLVRSMVPADFSFDLAVNVMEFNPGASLPMVEAHVMEHGLMMLAGGGIYRLSERWYPVAAGDFIWMGPYCPQWFAAVGKQPARYLIYKDWNRSPL